MQTAGSTYEVTDEEVEEGEIDKLVSRVKKEIDRVRNSDLCPCSLQPTVCTLPSHQSSGKEACEMLDTHTTEV